MGQRITAKVAALPVRGEMFVDQRGTERALRVSWHPEAGLVVLTTARRPSILVEVGFSTNPDDAKLLSTTASQKNLAASMADAVVAYLLEYERKVGEGSASAAAGRADTP